MEWKEKAFNCGLCVRGTNDVNSNDNEFYGILKEFIQLEYLGRIVKEVVLFSYEWFDPIMNYGTRVHCAYGIVWSKAHKRI